MPGLVWLQRLFHADPSPGCLTLRPQSQSGLFEHSPNTGRADGHYVRIQHLWSGLFSARIRSLSASPAAGARGDDWTEGRLLRSRINPFAKVQHCRLQVEILTEIRNPNLLQKVASQDDDLLLGGVLLALFCHTFSPYYLGGERFSPFPAEAGYLF